MLTNKQKNKILENMVKLLELPDTAYEKAKNRYKDMGEFYGRDESTLKDYEPHIFSQGSFRLGTAIRPLSEDEEYDLDLGCELKSKINKNTHSQYTLKTMIGYELDLYRKARGIKSPKEEKHRCWRLEYQDDLSFHMDIVPCIPSTSLQRSNFLENMQNEGLDINLASKIANLSISITDNRSKNYHDIDDDWNVSNPEGYAQWFIATMKSKYTLLNERAEVDEIPDYKLKTPLQRVIQLLKRHRDNMYKDDEDRKPISIIITTLATHAYNGEDDIESALKNILLKMDSFIKPNTPRVSNPTNHEEDFADKWSMSEYAYLNLEDNFRAWLEQARVDFDSISIFESSNKMVDFVNDKFSVKLSVNALESIGLVAVVPSASKEYTIKQENTTSPHRWI